MKKHNMDIIPMKRRHYGVSRTAKREQDWKFILSHIPTKAKQDAFLRKLGRS